MLDENVVTNRELSSTAELYRLFVMPTEQRGAIWRTALDKALWTAVVDIPTVDSQRTLFYQGFPYLRVNLPKAAREFAAHRVTDLAKTAIKYGLGLAFYLTADDQSTLVNHAEPLSRIVKVVEGETEVHSSDATLFARGQLIAANRHLFETEQSGQLSLTPLPAPGAEASPAQIGYQIFGPLRAEFSEDDIVRILRFYLRNDGVFIRAD